MVNARKVVIIAAAVVLAASAQAASRAAKCEAVKLKAAGSYSLCRLRATAKGVKIGPGAEISGDFLKCDTVFAKKWAAAEKRGGTSCPSVADAVPMQSLLTNMTTSAGARLGGLRFVDNGDGTVTDTQTGLMWEKKDGADAYALKDYADPHDVDNTYSWGAIFNSTVPDGTVYTDFLMQLNNCVAAGTTIGGGFAGYCDWRLPNFFELLEIVDTTQGFCAGGSGACIDPAFGPTRRPYYWTSTTSADNASDAWVVAFNGEDPPVTRYQKGTGVQPTIFVRAVRRAF